MSVSGLAKVRVARLTPTDAICLAADTPPRPMDFALVAHLRRTPDLAVLAAGAASAMCRYPTTGARVHGAWWASQASAAPSVSRTSVAGDAQAQQAISQLLDAPLDPSAGPTITQLLIEREAGPGGWLVTRVHHAVGDVASAALWLGHQLTVAAGRCIPVTRPMPHSPPDIQPWRGRARRSSYAYRRPADRLWCRPGAPERARGWHTLHIPADPLRAAASASRAFTYNDLLLTCVLDVLGAWNRRHLQRRQHRIGAWVPVNVRRQPFEGFGNGSSRIRVYARAAPEAPLAERCRLVREQVAWSKLQGEWALPSAGGIARWLPYVARPVLRAVLNRPWADMTTGAFSHVERWPEEAASAFDDMVEHIELIEPMHARHCLAVAATTLGDRTAVTFTYDRAQLHGSDVATLVDMLGARLAAAPQALR